MYVRGVVAVTHVVAAICGPVFELLSEIRDGRMLESVPERLDELPTQIISKAGIIGK